MYLKPQRPPRSPQSRERARAVRRRRTIAGAVLLVVAVVAERLAKPPSYVAKYEGGDRRLDVLEFIDVAAAIGFDPSKLIRILNRKKVNQ